MNKPTADVLLHLRFLPDDCPGPDARDGALDVGHPRRGREEPVPDDCLAVRTGWALDAGHSRRDCSAAERQL